MVRALAGSSAQLTTFAKVKDALKEVESLKDKPVVISFVASIVGGIFQCIAMTPFDVVSTRLYNQGKFLVTIFNEIYVQSLLISFNCHSYGVIMNNLKLLIC